MLVEHAWDPLIIIEAQTYLSGQELIPYNYTDAYGIIQTQYYWVNKYERKLLLSDGSIWVIRNRGQFKYFVIGKEVYVGVNGRKDNFDYFLIVGREREAKWSWGTSW